MQRSAPSPPTRRSAVSHGCRAWSLRRASRELEKPSLHLESLPAAQPEAATCPPPPNCVNMCPQLQKSASISCHTLPPGTEEDAEVWTRRPLKAEAPGWAGEQPSGRLGGTGLRCEEPPRRWLLVSPFCLSALQASPLPAPLSPRISPVLRRLQQLLCISIIGT